jgi:hypothetical protein
MTRTEKRAAIAFGVSLVAIGYRFLPVQAPDWLNWVASIALLGIGATIIFTAMFRKTS